jgi:hypothetical protein
MPRSFEECQKIIKEDVEKIPENLRYFDSESINDPMQNPWKRMVVGIVSCKKHNGRLQSFLMLFSDIFAELGLDYYIIYADPDIETEEGVDFSVDHDNRFFYAKSTEAYESLAHKLAIFYSYIYNHTDYEHVIKADDGCLINLSSVIKLLNHTYIGSGMHPTSSGCHRGKCSKKEYNHSNVDFGHNFMEFYPEMDDDMYKSLYKVSYAGGGYGYRIGREAMKHIDKYKAHILSIGLSYEDVIFGQVFFLEGIKLYWHGIGRYHFIGPGPVKK